MLSQPAPESNLPDVFTRAQFQALPGAVQQQLLAAATNPAANPLLGLDGRVALLHRLAPRYNRVGTTWQKYCYVRLTTDEAWPRLVVTNEPAATGVHIGPLTSRAMATAVIMTRKRLRIGMSQRFPSCSSLAIRSGKRAMTASRPSGPICTQRPISGSVRPQPRQKPVWPSTAQTLMHGDFIGSRGMSIANTDWVSPASVAQTA